MKNHTYMGVLITPASPNSYGIRWHAFGPLGSIRAETLPAIKDMIRSDHEQVLRERREALQVHRAHKLIMDNIWSNTPTA